MSKEELAYLLSEFVSNGHWSRFIAWVTRPEMGWTEAEVDKACDEIMRAAGRS